MELRGTTKLRSLHADKKGVGSPPLDPTLNCEGISRSLRPTSAARAYARMKFLKERNYTRYGAIVDQLDSGRCFRLTKVVRRIGTNTAPARHAFLQFVPGNAVNANQRSRRAVRVPKPAELGERLKERDALGVPFSVATPLHLTFGWSGVKGHPEVWGFCVAFLEYSQPSVLGMQVGRIWSCIGPIIALMAAAIDRLRYITSFREEIIATVACRKIKKPRICMFHEITAGMASTFNAVGAEQAARLRSRRLLDSHREKRRSTVNPQMAMASRWSRTRDGSSWGDVWPLGSRLRRRQECLRPLRTPLCASSAAGSPDTAVATL